MLRDSFTSHLCSPPSTKSSRIGWTWSRCYWSAFPVICWSLLSSYSSTNNFEEGKNNLIHSKVKSRATQSNFDVAAQQLSVTLLVLVDISHRSKTCHWPSHHQSQAVSTPLQGNKWLSSGSSTSGRKEGLSSGCVPGHHPIGKQYRCCTGHNSLPLPGSEWLSSRFLQNKSGFTPAASKLDWTNWPREWPKADKIAIGLVEVSQVLLLLVCSTQYSPIQQSSEVLRTR